MEIPGPNRARIARGLSALEQNIRASFNFKIFTSAIVDLYE
jgi:hypothetical protein